MKRTLHSRFERVVAARFKGFERLTEAELRALARQQVKAQGGLEKIRADLDKDPHEDGDRLRELLHQFEDLLTAPDESGAPSGAFPPSEGQR